MGKFSLERALNSGRPIILDTCFFYPTGFDFLNYFRTATSYRSIDTNLIARYLHMCRVNFDLARNSPNTHSIRDVKDENKKLLRAIKMSKLRLDNRGKGPGFSPERRGVADWVDLINNIDKFLGECSALVEDPRYFFMSDVIAAVDSVFHITKYLKNRTGDNTMEFNRGNGISTTDYNLVSLLFYGAMFFDKPPIILTGDKDIYHLVRRTLKTLEANASSQDNGSLFGKALSRPFQIIMFRDGKPHTVSNSDYVYRSDYGRGLFQDYNVGSEDQRWLTHRVNILLKSFEECNCEPFKFIPRQSTQPLNS